MTLLTKLTLYSLAEHLHVHNLMSCDKKYLLVSGNLAPFPPGQPYFWGVPTKWEGPLISSVRPCVQLYGAFLRLCSLYLGTNKRQTVTVSDLGKKTKHFFHF